MLLWTGQNEWQAADMVKTLKKNSEAWKLALRISRRKGANRTPIKLSPDGKIVTFRSLIRGNEWKRTLEELKLIANS